MFLFLASFLVALTVQAATSYIVDVSSIEFQKAVTDNGYPTPTDDQYNQFIQQATKVGAVSSKRELAMFLAQILWESDGLRAKIEYACVLTGCPLSYITPGCDIPGKRYYGRGYLQLSWCNNYRAASQSLFGDYRLVQDPDMVARDESVAWSSAYWFWKVNVHDKPGVVEGQFGATTKAINGAIECNGVITLSAKQRFEVYKKVLPAFDITETPNESGCYN